MFLKRLVINIIYIALVVGMLIERSGLGQKSTS